MVRALGLHRARRGGARARRLPRPRPGRRVDLRDAQSRRRAARVLQRLRPPRHEAPRRDRRRLRPRQQGVQVPVPRVGVRPRRAAHRHAQRRRGRDVRPGRLPAPRDRGRGVRRLPVREPRRARPAARRRSSATGNEIDHELRALPPRRAAARRGGSSTTSRRTGRSSSRTTTSASTARRSIPELVADRAALPFRRGLGRRDPRRRQLDGRWRDLVHPRPASSDAAAVPGPAARTTYGMYYGTFQFPNLLLNLHPDCGDGRTRSTRTARAAPRSSPSTCSGRRRSPRPTSRPTRWSSCGT